MDEWKSETHKIKTACGSLYLTVKFDGEKVAGILPSLGKSGDCSAALADTILTLTDVFEGHTVDWHDVAMRLMRIQCGKQSVGKPTCVHAMGECLLRVLDRTGEER